MPRNAPIAFMPIVPSEPVPERIIPIAFLPWSFASEVTKKSIGEYLLLDCLVRDVTFNILLEMERQELGGIT